MTEASPDPEFWATFQKDKEDPINEAIAANQGKRDSAVKTERRPGRRKSTDSA